MLLKVPKESRVYIFGSSLRCGKPNDIDVLVLYDSHNYVGKSTYAAHKQLKEQIEDITNLPADMTLLSYSEEKELSFIKNSKAISWEEYALKYCKGI